MRRYSVNFFTHARGSLSHRSQPYNVRWSSLYFSSVAKQHAGMDRSKYRKRKAGAKKKKPAQVVLRIDF